MLEITFASEHNTYRLDRFTRVSLDTCICEWRRRHYRPLRRGFATRGSMKMRFRSLPIERTLRYSFSAVSRPLFATMFSLGNSCRDLPDVHSRVAQSQKKSANTFKIDSRFYKHFSRLQQTFLKLLQPAAIFADAREFFSNILLRENVENRGCLPFLQFRD